MENKVKKELATVLACEGKRILNSKGEMKEKLDQMNEISNLEKIIINFEEVAPVIEPVLRDYFCKKAKEKRYERNERD